MQTRLSSLLLLLLASTFLACKAAFSPGNPRVACLAVNTLRKEEGPLQLAYKTQDPQCPNIKPETIILSTLAPSPEDSVVLVSAFLWPKELHRAIAVDQVNVTLAFRRRRRDVFRISLITGTVCRDQSSAVAVADVHDWHLENQCQVQCYTKYTEYRCKIESDMTAGMGVKLLHESVTVRVIGSRIPTQEVLFSSKKVTLSLTDARDADDQEEEEEEAKRTTAAGDDGGKRGNKKRGGGRRGDPSLAMKIAIISGGIALVVVLVIAIVVICCRRRGKKYDSFKLSRTIRFSAPNRTLESTVRGSREQLSVKSKA